MSKQFREVRFVLIFATFLVMAPRGKELSDDLKKLILKYHKEHKSLREIGRLIDRSFATVQKIVNKYKSAGSTTNKERCGRPPLLSPREKSLVVRKIRTNPKISAPKLKSEVENETGKQFSTQTIRRVLHSAGYHGLNVRKKPFVSSVNRSKRISFAKDHEKYDQTFWNQVIFSDECKFSICGSDGREKDCRKVNAELDPNNMTGTVKNGGGSVMVWGCMAANGVGNLVFIENIMDQYGYLNILKNNLKESATKLGLGGTFIFQQDNDPKHTSNIVREWLLYNVRKQLKTPPQSPDTNPIEHLWEHLKRQIRKHPIRNKEQLKNVLQEEWNKIPPAVTENLVKSMPSRLKAIVKSNGYPTKY